MGAQFRLSYRRLLAWLGVGLLLDWAMTIAAVRFLGATEMNPLWVSTFNSGNHFDLLFPLLVKAAVFLFFAMGYRLYGEICSENPEMWWVRHPRVVPSIALVIAWGPVAWNTKENILYLMGV